MFIICYKCNLRINDISQNIEDRICVNSNCICFHITKSKNNKILLTIFNKEVKKIFSFVKDDELYITNDEENLTNTLYSEDIIKTLEDIIKKLDYLRLME